MAFILIADDLEELRDVYGRHLEDAGHRVSSASNGREVLERVVASPPDLILMDVEMPELDGMNALRELRTAPRFARVRNIPVVLLTCYAMPDQIQAGLAAGCDAYVIKPVDPEEILRELELILNSGEVPAKGSLR